MLEMRPDDILHKSFMHKFDKTLFFPAQAFKPARENKHFKSQRQQHESKGEPVSCSVFPGN